MRQLIVTTVITLVLLSGCSTRESSSYSYANYKPNSNGKAIYDARCKACHGVDGKMKALGKSNPIAGSGTVEKDLEGYRAGTLNKHGMGSIMKGNAAALSDANIRDVAAYVASLGNSTSTSSRTPLSSSNEYSKSATDHYNNALDNVGRGYYNLAIEQLNNAISMNPYVHSYYDLLGDAQSANNQCYDAIISYTKAINISPRSYTYLSRGKCYITTKQEMLAKADAKKACEMGECRLMQYFKNKK